MSLQPRPIDPIPEMTARNARAAFGKGNPYLVLRDQLGVLFHVVYVLLVLLFLEYPDDGFLFAF